MTTIETIRDIHQGRPLMSFGFNKEDVRHYTEGQCYALATMVSNMSLIPLTPVMFNGEAHAFLRTREGLLLDVEGVWAEIDLAVNWSWTFDDHDDAELKFLCPPHLIATTEDVERYMVGRTIEQKNRLIADAIRLISAYEAAWRSGEIHRRCRVWEEIFEEKCFALDNTCTACPTMKLTEQTPVPIEQTNEQRQQDPQEEGQED